MLRFTLEPIASEQSMPGENLKVGLFGPMRSPVYKKAHAPIDVLHKHLFAVSSSKFIFPAVVSVPVGMLYGHSYILPQILCDLGIAFTSEVFDGFTPLLEIRKTQVSPEHAQTFSVVEPKLKKKLQR